MDPTTGLLRQDAGSDELVRAVRLTKHLGGRSLWGEVSFRLANGSSLAVTGPSGAGKSTLLNCVGLLDEPDSGLLAVGGESTATITSRRRRHLLRSAVGHLFQNYGLVDDWTVDRNIDLAFAGRRAFRRDRRGLRESALERVGLAGTGGVRAYELSGGEQQRVALARILVKRPRVVVADEPSAALDAENVALVLSVLTDLREGGSAVVVATHDDSVASWCGETLHLEGPAHGSPSARNSPRERVARTRMHGLVSTA